MIGTQSILFGWLSNNNLYDAITNYSEIGDELPFALISCIDSTRIIGDYNSLMFSEVLTLSAQHQYWYKFLDYGLSLDTHFLGFIQQNYNIFNGFDEVWFFDDKPEHLLSPPASITSEMPIIEVGQIYDDWRTETTKWMLQNNCLLGLGDGIGLNYATPILAVAQKIEEAKD